MFERNLIATEQENRLIFFDGPNTSEAPSSLEADTERPDDSPENVDDVAVEATADVASRDIEDTADVAQNRIVRFDPTLITVETAEQRNNRLQAISDQIDTAQNSLTDRQLQASHRSIRRMTDNQIGALRIYVNGDNRLGLNINENSTLDDLTRAVIAFQISRDIMVDGIVGPQTLGQLRPYEMTAMLQDLRDSDPLLSSGLATRESVEPTVSPERVNFTEQDIAFLSENSEGLNSLSLLLGTEFVFNPEDPQSIYDFLIELKDVVGDNSTEILSSNIRRILVEQTQAANDIERRERFQAATRIDIPNMESRLQEIMQERATQADHLRSLDRYNLYNVSQNSNGFVVVTRNSDRRTVTITRENLAPIEREIRDVNDCLAALENLDGDVQERLQLITNYVLNHGRITTPNVRIGFRGDQLHISINRERLLPLTAENLNNLGSDFRTAMRESREEGSSA